MSIVLLGYELHYLYLAVMREHTPKYPFRGLMFPILREALVVKNANKGGISNLTLEDIANQEICTLYDVVRDYAER